MSENAFAWEMIVRGPAAEEAARFRAICKVFQDARHYEDQSDENKRDTVFLIESIKEISLYPTSK